MKVKCVDNSKAGYELRLSIGKEYSVLAVEVYFNSNGTTKSFGELVKYRIVDDQEMVIPAEASCFTITCEELPDNWVAFSSNESSIDFLPKMWAYKSFWDYYYNDEENALEAFSKEVKFCE